MNQQCTSLPGFAASHSEPGGPARRDSKRGVDDSEKRAEDDSESADDDSESEGLSSRAAGPGRTGNALGAGQGAMGKVGGAGRSRGARRIPGPRTGSPPLPLPPAAADSAGNAGRAAGRTAAAP
jgi:hypothetical protein